jgi:hypothetical protein
VQGGSFYGVACAVFLKSELVELDYPPYPLSHNFRPLMKLFSNYFLSHKKAQDLRVPGFGGLVSESLGHLGSGLPTHEFPLAAYGRPLN